MSKEQIDLMQPRIKVLTDTPYKNSFKKDDVLYQFFDEGQSSTRAYYWAKAKDDELFLRGYKLDYPSLFRELPWYEGRTPEQMPEYVKDADSGMFYKVAAKDQDYRVWHTEGEIEFRHLIRWGYKYLPVTEQEYNTYQSSLNNTQP